MSEQHTPKYDLSIFIIGEHGKGQSRVASFLVSRLIMRDAKVDWVDPNPGGKDPIIDEDQLRQILKDRHILVKVIDVDHTTSTIIAS